MRTIELSARKVNIVLRFEPDLRLGNKLKRVGGVTYNQKRDYWSVKLTVFNIERFLKFIEVNNFQVINEGVWDLIESTVQKLLDLRVIYDRNRILSGAEKLEKNFHISGLNYQPRDYQFVPIKYIELNKRVLIGDDPGIGKTFEAIASIQHLNAYPVIVSCPNSLKYNWKAEELKWLSTGKSLKIIDVNTKTIKEDLNHDIVIMSYNNLIKFKKDLFKKKFKSVVCDESHWLRSASSQRSNIAIDFVNETNIDVRILLSGTPILKRPKELIPQLDILGKMGDFGGWMRFARRYCGLVNGLFGIEMNGATNLQELHIKLREICYVKRTKTQVLKELPPKQYVNINVEIKNKREYNKAKKDVVQWIRDNFDDQELVNKKVRGALLAKVLVRFGILRELAVKGKMDHIIEWIENFLESGKKLIVSGEHTEYIDFIADYFKCNKLTGAENDIEIRQSYVDDFQDNPETKLIVMNSRVGGVGFNMFAASDVFFIERPWNPGDYDQVLDRTHRSGQVNVCTGWNIIGIDTVDEYLSDIIGEKRLITSMVNEGVEFEEETLDIEYELINELLK